jgi:UDP-glucose 4-epimerase
MNVLVTGGTGFIGTAVCEELRLQDHKPIVLDRRGGMTSFPSILGDVRDANAVTEAVAHVEGVIHLAAVLGTQETINNPRPSADININGSINVFEACTQYDIPCVYIGVGNHWMRTEGAGAYTITKTCAEDLARMYVKFRGSRIQIVRPVNAYGPGQSVAAPFGDSKVRKIMPSFICRALCNHSIEVYGDGEQVSDMVHVSDVARVLVHMLGQPPAERIVEVGPAESATVNAVAAFVRQAAQSDAPIVHLPMRPGEVPNAVVSADTSTMTDVGIDVAAFQPLAAGIWDTVKWFRDAEGITWHRP